MSQDVDEERPIRLGDVVRDAARRDPAGEALVFRDQRLTFEDLRSRVDDCARGLMALGVERGDRVSVWMPNNIEWILTYLAIARIGAVLVPVNTSFRVEEAVYVVGQSASSTLVVPDSDERIPFLEMARAVIADPSVSVANVVVVNSDGSVGGGPAGMTTFAEMIQQGREQVTDAALAVRCDAVDGKDPLFIFYTSGTTGFPKGVVHSHKVVHNMAGVADRLGLGREDVIVLYLPLFHVFASLAAVITFVLRGGRIVLMPRFSAVESLRLMELERATVVYGMQPIYHDQLASLASSPRDLSSVRLCITPAAPSFVRTVGESIGRAITVYGMTETTAMTSLPFATDSAEVASETVGHPLNGFQVQVVDPETLAPLPTNSLGEIVVRGPHVMLGYYGQPEATAKAFTPDGWFRTGDLGRLDEAGYIRFGGRLKDIIRVGGENFDPSEVETVLGEHPKVALAAVVGQTDTRMGEVAVAYVQLAPGETVDVEELTAFVRHERLFVQATGFFTSSN